MYPAFLARKLKSRHQTMNHGVPTSENVEKNVIEKNTN